MIVFTGQRGFIGGTAARLFDERQIFHADYIGDLLGTVDSGQFQAGDVVVHCAYPATGGIGSMGKNPADIARDGLRIDLNVIDTCAKRNVGHLICLGSVCSYPEDVELPAREAHLWAGYPEPTNAPYGVAKRMQLELLMAYRRQYGLKSTQLIMGNLYGPGDRSNHVIPATIRKVLHAQQVGADHIEVWGDGTASRDFLYIDDAARAVLFAAHTVPPQDVRFMNICSGTETTILDMVRVVMRLCDFHGEIRWLRDFPTGQQRRRFDIDRAKTYLQWMPTTQLVEGLRRTIAWMRERHA